jgi:hypothetical protein
MVTIYIRVEATNTNVIVFGFIRQEIEITIYHIGGDHASHYITEAAHLNFSRSLCPFMTSQSFVHETLPTFQMGHTCTQCFMVTIEISIL